MPKTVVIRVTEEYHVSKVRLAARTMAEALGFKKIRSLHIMTSVSELANNLFFHTGRGGTITLVPLQQGKRVGMQVVAEDHGPGIEDIDKAMEDGFSTKGGLGSGLPGVRRLMDEFEICSTVGAGTRVTCTEWKEWG